MQWTSALLALLTVAPVVIHAQSFRSETPLPVIGFANDVVVAGGMIHVGRSGVVTGFPMPSAEAGAVHVFARGTNGWAEVNAVRPRDGVVADAFGAALSVDGDFMAVGAPGAGEGRGAIYIFERGQDGTWLERAKLFDRGGTPGDRLGSALALGSGVVIVGAPGVGDGRGAAIVFRRAANGTWSEQSRLTPSGTAAGDGFGSAVSLSGDGALLGAPGPGMGSGPARAGQAFVFRRSSSGEWREEAKLVADGDTTARSVGAAVVLEPAGAFVGAPMSGGAVGAVFHFRREGSTWRQVTRLAPAGSDQHGMFGSALARDGSDLFVGAPFTGGAAGAVHVWRLDGSVWKEAQALTTASQGMGVGLGAALSAEGRVAVAGAPMGDFFEGVGYVYAKDAATGEWRQDGKIHEKASPALAAVTGNEVRCDSAGKAGGFACREADLVSFVPVSALGGKRGIMLNDIWGWSDPETGREFALVGRLDGMAIVDVTNPAQPVYMGELPLHEGASPNMWRDIKVYRNHAFIVADGAGPHGVQVLDLTQLRSVTNTPVTFTETAHYDRIASAHNIVIDTTSGFAYTVGNSMGGETCGGALHMIDIRDPRKPSFAGCFADPATGSARTGYTHDSQCVVYHGPDTQYRGRQICFNSSETAVGIADVTDKQSPKRISSASYPNVSYAHQGWLSDDHRFFFLNDEGDEISGTAKSTRTLVFDVADLDDPVVAKEFFGTTPASDHNLYVRDRYMYQSNYVAGLRIIDVQDPTNPVEVGFFDTVPFGKDQAGFAGSWSNYPYFRNGVVAVTSMREGLFLIRFRKGATIVP